jgi:hypothetical protein
MWLASFLRRSVLLQVLEGTADANIRFADLRRLLLSLGFAGSIKGGHHIPRAALAKLQMRLRRTDQEGNPGPALVRISHTPRPKRSGKGRKRRD